MRGTRADFLRGYPNLSLRIFTARLLLRQGNARTSQRLRQLHRCWSPDRHHDPSVLGTFGPRSQSRTGHSDWENVREIGERGGISPPPQSPNSLSLAPKAIKENWRKRTVGPRLWGGVAGFSFFPHDLSSDPSPPSLLFKFSNRLFLLLEYFCGKS